MTDTKDYFLTDYAAWLQDRERLSNQEASDTFPAPGDWADSDDTAVDLLHRAAALLGAPS